MIDEKRLYTLARNHREENPTDSNMHCETRGQAVWLDLNEVDSIVQDIDGQIVSRDYKLIDQAEMIVAYVPLDLDGSPLIAGGVQSELEHAAACTKEVVVVWEAAREPTPFIHQRADKRFSSLAQLEEYLKEITQPTGQLEMHIESP